MNDADFQKLRATLLSAAGIIKIMAGRDQSHSPIEEIIGEIHESLEVLNQCKNESAAALLFVRSGKNQIWMGNS
jgi:hypothetical protein